MVTGKAARAATGGVRRDANAGAAGEAGSGGHRRITPPSHFMHAMLEAANLPGKGFKYSIAGNSSKQREMHNAVGKNEGLNRANLICTHPGTKEMCVLCSL
jgi:hypothetical protein